MVREGYWVPPDNVDRALGRFIAVAQQSGLEVKWASTPYGLADLAEDAGPLSVLADHGIAAARLTYIPRSAVDDPRKLNEHIARLCEKVAGEAVKRGIRVVVQLHGGFHPHNATAAWECIRGCDPKGIGIMLDPGNNANQEGTEIFWYQVALLREYIAGIGVKDSRHVQRPGEFAASSTQFVPVGEGENDWPTIVRELRRARGEVPHIFMPFYEHEQDMAAVLKREVSLIRDALA
jgi:sugar phosphate isomerase/epimerase